MGRRWRVATRVLFARNRVEQDLDDELRAFVDELVQRRIREGIPPAEARRQVLVEVGRVDALKDGVRDVLPGMPLANLTQDVWFAARMLWRNRAFAASATTDARRGMER